MNRPILSKICFSFLFLFSFSNMEAQSFSELKTTIKAVTSSTVKHTDVDNDGDQDLLIAGFDTSSNPIAKLYLNDGKGGFVEKLGSSFTGISDGDIGFSDVDQDGDEDVIITGLDKNSNGSTKLYLNNGSGVFSEDQTTSFKNVYGSGIGFSDIDQDGDEDVIITGFDKVSSSLNAILYTNDGQGVFTEVSGTPFKGSWDGSVKFIDIDQDGDEDVLLTGRDNAHAASAILYENTNGTFREVSGTPFIGVLFTSIASADIDSDGDIDILISGQNAAFDPITELYINNNGTFTKDVSNAFVEVNFGSNDFSDIDLDGDQDVMITGTLFDQGRPISVTKLYSNDGKGNFTEVSGEPFVEVGTSAICFFDADGDQVEDVLITGDLGNGTATTNLYINQNEPQSINTHRKVTTTVYPNPVRNGIINIQLPQDQAGKLNSIRLLDINGRYVLDQTITISRNNYSINGSSMHLKGIYFLELSYGDNMEKIKVLIP